MPIRRTLFLIAILAGVAICFQSSAQAAGVDSTQLLQQKIAAAYGVDRFDAIDAIRYTFNLENAGRRVKREWTWEPKTGCIGYQGKGPGGVPTTFNYTRSRTVDSTDTTLTAYVDQRFINDNYWLLFPFHIAWDSNTVLSTDGPTHSLEQSKGRRLTVKYTAGGYTPGDMYEVFIDPDGLLSWWVFHRGGPEAEGLAMTWEKHVRAGPITLTVDHFNRDKTFHLWFSDIAVRLHGSNTWIDAQ